MQTEEELKITGPAFDSLREDFDDMLSRTVESMDEKKAENASVTMKLGIEMEQVQLENGRKITRPTFKYDISSVLQVKDRISGTLVGDYEMFYNDGAWHMRLIDDGQTNIFDADYTVVSDGPDSQRGLTDGGKALSDFEWLLSATMAGGREDLAVMARNNVTFLINGKNKVLLSSSCSPKSQLFLNSRELAEHADHRMDVWLDWGERSRMCVCFGDRDTGEIFHAVYAQDGYRTEIPEELEAEKGVSWVWSDSCMARSE